MFTNLLARITKRVVRFINKHITKLISKLSSLPKRMLFSGNLKRMSRLPALLRAILTPSLFYPELLNEKFLITEMTNPFNILHYLIINPNKDLVKNYGAIL
jgi:hypothetical protein